MTTGCDHPVTDHGETRGCRICSCPHNWWSIQGSFCESCTCGDTFNPQCPEHGGNEHRP